MKKFQASDISPMPIESIILCLFVYDLNNDSINDNITFTIPFVLVGFNKTGLEGAR